MVRSTTQRWRPSRVEDSMPLRAMRWRDAALAEPLPQVVVVVALVAVELGGPAPAGPAAGADRRDAPHERLRPWLSCMLAPEMPTRQGQTGPFGDQVDLRPYLPRSTGFGPVRSPFSGPACSPSRSRSGTSPVRRGRRARPGPGGGACAHTRALRPLGETPVGGRARTARTTRRQLLPRAARRGHEHDRGQHLPVTVPPPAAALRPRRRLRHHPLEQLPQLIRHQPLNDPHTGSLPNTPNEMPS